jgi:4-oxalocrotonate tautomerase
MGSTMPLVRIDLAAGKPAAYRTAISDVVYGAMTSVLKAPEHDRFMVISEHAADNLVVDPCYLGIHRTADAVLIQVTLNEGRDVTTKKGFYRAVADGLHERIGLRREDVFISLVEVKKENWSFGNGEAQYA